ncbi:MAG: alpha/beta hydrolase, partial [Kiritimatiellae bacterium]|nr:alpha/beta hydrolase [Kiritimatiellia bacterium]
MKMMMLIATIGLALAACAAETGINAIGEKSREEIVSFFTDNEFGRRPKEAEKPPLLKFEKISDDKLMPDGKMVRKQVRIVYGGSCGTNSFPVTAFVPAGAKGPVPAFLLICNRDYKENCDPEREKKSPFFPVEEIVKRGFAAVSFYTWDVAPDYNTGNTKGVFEAFEKPGAYRDPKLWGTISAWGWGASRALDWLETVPEIDAKKVAVVGHSRGGKTALWTAVTDPRFAMVCVNGSGCAGAKLNHLDLPKSEHIAQIVRTFQYWFCLDYTLWVNREQEMPFDQHELLSCVA